TVPDETKHVIIESGASFYPEVPANFYINSGGSAYKCKSLTIKSGGLATIGNAGGGAGSDMIVYGNLKVETGGILKIADDLSLESGGNFYVTGGTVESFINTSTGFGDWLFKTGSGGYMTGGVLTVFSDLIFYGGSNWSVSGGTFHMGGSAAIVTVITADSDLQLNDFIVDAGVTAFISTSSSAPLSVSADFTMDAGSKFSISAGETLLISGDVLMKSDASSSSSLINLGTMTISGTSTVERFMTDDQWHLLSSPVGGATASSLYFSGSPKVHLKKYLEASNTWEFITALSTPLTQGRGFAYWIDEATFRSDVTVAFTGSSLLSSDLTLTSFGYSGDTDHGFNLVGNPFPSA
ncbi:MAG: hypothetical protein KAH06_09905, partial [Desulfobacterales bacterium]|nr:hypothetical protein [Desulfobacterales bacterium]